MMYVRRLTKMTSTRLVVAAVVTLLVAPNVNSAPKRHLAKRPLRPLKGKTVSSHAPFESKACGFCHVSKNPKKPGAAKKDVYKLCYSCHAELKSSMAKNKYKHAVMQSGCGTCHNPHNSTHKGLLLSSLPKLCNDCHTDTAAQMNSKFKHDALTSGKSCVGCHDPHGSSIQHLLLFLPFDGCIKCHSTDNLKDDKKRTLTNYKKLLATSTVKHSPVAGKDCSACHQVHGSNNFRLLTEPYPAKFYSKYSKKAYALCFKCHDEAAFLSPTTRTATAFRDGSRNMHYIHVKGPERGRTCRACHAVHAANQSFLIRESVPYGTSGWKLKVHYVKTKNGGSCQKTCHGHKDYDRSKK